MTYVTSSTFECSIQTSGLLKNQAHGEVSDYVAPGDSTQNGEWSTDTLAAGVTIEETIVDPPETEET